MNLKLGAEPKKLAILVGLLVVALVVFVSNSSEDTRGSATATTAPRVAPQAASPVPGINQPAAARPAPRNTRGQRTLTEFRPSLRRKPEERVDPTTVDPALKTELIAKLQKVTLEGNSRSIFEFGAAPPPPKPPEAAKAKSDKPVPSPLVDPAKPPVDVAAAPPAKPPAPPIPLKFYGYISPSAQNKRAFFLEGEEIHIVNEGDMVKRRYKIVRIGINSVVVEDTQFQSQQTLPLEEQPG